jgi:hypothetical protein
MKEGTMQHLLQHLNTTRSELLQAVEGLTQEEFDFKPGAGQWSIGHIVQHLHASERMTCERLYKMVRGEMTEQAEWKSLRKIPVRFITNRIVKVKTTPDLEHWEDKPKEEVLQQLSISREQLLVFIEEYKEIDVHYYHAPHPILGLIDIEEWLYFIGYHEVRHRKQIEEVKALMEKK